MGEQRGLAPLLTVDLAPVTVELNLRESGARFPCKWSSVLEIYSSATKDSATENGELKITKMYDADGNETSLYSQVYAKATSSGTSTLVTSGSWYDVPIPSSFQAASKSVSLYCKGHIPWIDCKISGYWNVH